MGFSAGGHLAASYGVFWNRNFVKEAVGCSTELLRPNGLILCYPVISTDEKISHIPSIQNLLGVSYDEKREQVSLENPGGRTGTANLYVAYRGGRNLCPWNSFRFAQALGKAGISLEYHLYPKGIHGLSLATESIKRKDGSGTEKSCKSWFSLLRDWILENYGL